MYIQKKKNLCETYSSKYYLFQTLNLNIIRFKEWLITYTRQKHWYNSGLNKTESICNQLIYRRLLKDLEHTLYL